MLYHFWRFFTIYYSIFSLMCCGYYLETEIERVIVSSLAWLMVDSWVDLQQIMHLDWLFTFLIKVTFLILLLVLLPCSCSSTFLLFLFRFLSFSSKKIKFNKTTPNVNENISYVVTGSDSLLVMPCQLLI